MWRTFLGVLLFALSALSAAPTDAMPGVPPVSASRPDVIPVEFWCSPGFEPHGGRCIAALSRDELFIYETDAAAPPPVRRRHRARRGLRELY